jgi:hypothetical protein
MQNKSIKLKANFENKNEIFADIEKMKALLLEIDELYASLQSKLSPIKITIEESIVKSE